MINKQKILVVSGKKQAGKNTVANFIQGIVCLQEKLIEEFEVSESTLGELFVKRRREGVSKKVSTDLGFPHVKKYEFADQLKLILKNFFGLTDEQLSGTNEQKNVYVKYVWENMPGLAETEFAGRTGQMLARELTQYMGTEVFRKIYDQIHIEATYNKIIIDGASIATINGARFPNEVVYRPTSSDIDVKTIRLARTLFPNDRHKSEVSLDREVFDWSNFDLVIDNQNLTIEETCKILLKELRSWGWVK